MREAYKEYIIEHPEEIKEVVALIKRSKDIEKARQERIKKKLALIQQCREELEHETCDKRS